MVVLTTTLESHFPEIVRAQPTLLAQHCAEAGMINKAFDHRLKAAHQAIEHSAMLEAEAQLNEGLNLLASLPEDGERQHRELEALCITSRNVGLSRSNEKKLLLES